MLHDLMKRFFRNKGYHGKRKKDIFPVVIATITKKKNASLETWDLEIYTNTEKIEVII